MFRRVQQQRLSTEKREEDTDRRRPRRVYDSERVDTEPVMSSEAPSVTNFRIKVYIRVRPINLRQEAERAVNVESNKTLTVDWVDKKQKHYSFSFDRVFDQHQSNRVIYDELQKDLTGGLLLGYNSSVFAYGATGSGKTFTMFGSGESQPGIAYLCLQDIFKDMQPQIQLNDFIIKMSCVELYNENLFDLLSQNLSPVDLRESPTKGVFLSGATETMISSVKQAWKLLKKVMSRRQTQATLANQNSSRSHAIIQLLIEQKERFQGFHQELSFSKLSLIDLAGSEKWGISSNTYEAKKINQSLLVLGNCINQLSKNSQRGFHNHVPYRNSKLTRLLKDSLGGNTRTTMISTISSSISAYDETYNTLVYSSYTNKIEVKLRKNSRKIDRTHVTDYARIINELKSENQKIRKELGTDMDTKIFEQDKIALDKGFQRQIQVRHKLVEVESRLQALQFDQYRTLYTQSKCQKMFKPTNPAELEKLREMQQQLTEEYNRIRQERKLIIQRCKPAKDAEILKYVNQKVLQFEINQLNSEKIQQNKKTTELEAQRIEVNLLLEQLKQRQKIISKHNKVLGKDDTHRPIVNLAKEPDNQELNKNQKWFYNFLDQLDNREERAVLPSIKKRSESKSQIEEEMTLHQSAGTPTEPTLPPFKRYDYRPANRIRSKSIKHKTEAKAKENSVEEVSKNQFSQFLQKNISRYQSYKSRKF